MKFNIYTTGDDFNRYGSPHEKAKYITKRAHVNYCFNNIYEIEFNSLEELTEFITGLGVIFGDGVIIKRETDKDYPHIYTIEIYDDYRE